MAKSLMKLKVRLPMYGYPRNAWRREIHRVVAEELKSKRVHYKRDDMFDITVRLYFEKAKLEQVDIDNRVKDVFDALQGHVGGRGKKQRALKPIIQNDSQIFRVTAEKCLPPGQSHGFGHLTIRRYRGPVYR